VKERGLLTKKGKSGFEPGIKAAAQPRKCRVTGGDLYPLMKKSKERGAEEKEKKLCPVDREESHEILKTSVEPRTTLGRIKSRLQTSGTILLGGASSQQNTMKQ